MTKMDFELKGFPTFQELEPQILTNLKRTLEWLAPQIYSIIYSQGIFCFIYASGKQFHHASEELGFTPLRLIKMSKTSQGTKKGLPIYAKKKKNLNKFKNILKKEKLE